MPESNPTTKTTQSQANTPEVFACDVANVHTQLGWQTPLTLPEASQSKPLSQWRMELDDAEILAQLFAQHAPKRHLEFGTWQGQGTLLCLQNCQATVWTLNLLEGEKNEQGGWCYSEPVEGEARNRQWANAFETKAGLVFMQTDALGLVGHRIHAEGLGHRVCQVYCDSRDWDTSNYPSDFFDSVLVDGGHDPETVQSDTRKALSVLRPGGLIMWHDFCIDPEVVRDCSTVADVQQGLFGMWESLQAACSQLFWIRPSWLLVGVKG